MSESSDIFSKKAAPNGAVFLFKCINIIMISFYDWLEYTFIGKEIENSPQISARKISNILKPESEKFNIIPVRLGYDTYKIFKNYSFDNKFKYCDNLLDRRGDSVDWTTVKASNEEIANLRELANFIINNSKNQNEVRVAKSTLERISAESPA